MSDSGLQLIAVLIAIAGIAWGVGAIAAFVWEVWIKGWINR